MPSKKYVPSNSIKKRIIQWEGSSMQTNRSFDLEAADFLRRLEIAKIYNLMSQDELDALFSYSYNVGNTTFAKRTIPHLVKLYNGTGTLNNVLNNIYGTKDKTLPGLRKRRNIERLLFKDAYNRRISLKKVPKAHTYLAPQETNSVQQELNNVPSYTWNPNIVLQKPENPQISESQSSYTVTDVRYPTRKRIESLHTGGRLIKRGQYGTPLYHKTLYLEKDGDEQESPHKELKSWIPDITPEERMDLTTLLLKDRVSTYKPTKELQIASLGIAHPFHWYDYLTAAPIAIPVVGATVATAPEWGPPALATVSNPAFWGELLKDTGTYIAADAASQGLTGKGIGAHVNNAIGLEEEHPVGEILSFSAVNPTRKLISEAIKPKNIKSEITNGIEKALEEFYPIQTISEEATPYGTKVIQNNGKIRLRLASHTDLFPREIVLDPQGNNKFYAHVRTWNDVDGKVPANLTPREIGYLYEALYNELPEGAEILFPLSGPGNYATRGTVAGLQRLARDPRFSKGSSGTLLYIDKDGSVKEFTGTSFIKTPINDGHIINYKSTVPTAPGDSWYHYGILPVLDTYFRPLLHVLGNAAVNMFKEYGGIEIPDLPIKKEIYGYVPEARVRYGLLGNINITDDEIALALYKQMLENNVISHEEWGPIIGFRGSTRRSNYLWPHKLPQTQVASGGTMDNTLGTLFLGQLPHVHPRAPRFANWGVDRYLVTAKPMPSDFNPNIVNMNVESSETTGVGVTNEFPIKIPFEENFHKYLLYLLGDHQMFMYKVKPEYVRSGINDLNAYMFRTPYLRDVSNQMSVGEWDRTFDPLLKFEWLTKEKPVYIEEDGPVRAAYKGHQFYMFDGGTEQGFLRLLIADLYDAIHDFSKRLQLGLYFSKRNTPFRGEHRDYLYLTLPLWNIRNAKHILPYDLRLPRLWGDPNVYLKSGGKISKNKK